MCTRGEIRCWCLSKPLLTIVASWTAGECSFFLGMACKQAPKLPVAAKSAILFGKTILTLLYKYKGIAHKRLLSQEFFKSLVQHKQEKNCPSFHVVNARGSAACLFLG